MPSASTPRVFTLAEINELVPTLASLVGRQLTRRSDIEQRLKKLSEALGDVPSDLAVKDDDPVEVRSMKRELAVRVEEYQVGWRDVEELGGVLKDARQGLVDFYGRVDGKLVWLCWRYGESEVTHFHALDEGFTGRKELRDSMRHRLLN